MSKTSAQIYQDIEAIDATDRDIVISQELLKELALGAANTAAGLETINAYERGPLISPTAASMYALVDAIDESDRDGTTIQNLLKMIALLMAKMAQEIESIRTGIAPQLRTQECSATISLSSSDSLVSDIFLAASASLAASCECVVHKAAAASASLSASSITALCKEFSVGISLSDSAEGVFSIILADSISATASYTHLTKKVLEGSTTFSASYAFFASKTLAASTTLTASCTPIFGRSLSASTTLTASTSDNVIKKELSASITATASYAAV